MNPEEKAAVQRILARYVQAWNDGHPLEPSELITLFNDELGNL